MLELGTWVGGWVGGCQTPPPGGGLTSVAEWGQLQQHHGKGVTIDLDARITL